MLHFEPLTSEHFPLLHRWMQEPHVAEWWGEGKTWGLEEIEKKYSTYTQGYKLHKGDKKSIYPFLIYFQGLPVGYIQTYNALDFAQDEFDVEKVLSEADFSLAGLDFYIGALDYLGKGLGAESLKVFLGTHVFPRFDACLVDSDKKNTHAIKAYSQAGFSTVQERNTNIAMVARKKEKIHPIIIFGSSRSDGHTFQAIKTVIQDQPIPIVDLRDLHIAPYDYTYANAGDDFISLAEKMVQYNPIILATPVYWFSMSAFMKTFIDRWSDLLDVRKDIGRRLAGKELYVISSYGVSIPSGFEDAFSQTCSYLDMQYRGCYYFYSGHNIDLIQQNASLAHPFRTRIFSGNRAE